MDQRKLLFWLQTRRSDNVIFTKNDSAEPQWVCSRVC